MGAFFLQFTVLIRDDSFDLSRVPIDLRDVLVRRVQCISDSVHSSLMRGGHQFDDLLVILAGLEPDHGHNAEGYAERAVFGEEVENLEFHYSVQLSDCLSSLTA